MVKSIWNPEGVTIDEKGEALLILDSLLQITDPSFQRKYLLFLQELKDYFPRVRPGKKSWGDIGVIGYLDRFICQRYLPKGPNEAFGILGAEEGSKVLLSLRGRKFRFPTLRRWMGVGYKDKGQTRSPAVFGPKVKDLLLQLLRESDQRGIDYRETRAEILPNASIEINLSPIRRTKGSL